MANEKNRAFVNATLPRQHSFISSDFCNFCSNTHFISRTCLMFIHCFIFFYFVNFFFNFSLLFVYFLNFLFPFFLFSSPCVVEDEFAWISRILFSFLFLACWYLAYISCSVKTFRIWNVNLYLSRIWRKLKKKK